MKEEKTNRFSLKSGRNAVLAVVFGLMFIYGAVASYREFVVRPKEDAQRAAEREKGEMAKDPLFANIQFDSSGEAVPKDSAKNDKNSSKSAGKNAKPISKKEMETLSEFSGTFDASAIQWSESAFSSAVATGVVRLGRIDSQLHLLNVSITPTSNSALTDEQLIDGISEVALRNIDIEEQLEPPFGLNPAAGSPAENGVREWSSKAKAYVQVDAVMQRIIVDAKLRIELKDAEQIAVRFEVQSGERPSVGLLIDADAEKNYRLYFAGEQLHSFVK